jgi:hypothetical protein
MTSSILPHVCGTNQAKGLFTRLIAQSEPTKTCTKCGESKSFASFRWQNKKKDGLRGQCKACEASATTAYRAANHDKVLASTAAWRAANPEKVTAQNAAWRTANPGRMRELNAAWREANPERMRALNSAYYAANRDKEIVRSLEWAKANPEYVRIRNQNREALKKQNGGKLSKNITKLLMAEQGCKCAGCLVDLLTTGYHLDHVMPIALGGPNIDENIQLLCPTCNSSKNAKHPLAWMAAKGIFSANP